MAHRKSAAGDAPATGRAGFVLLEVIVAFAIIGLIFGVAWARAPVRTSAQALQAVAFEVMALMRDARSRAGYVGRDTPVVLDATRHQVQRDGGRVLLPVDVTASIASGAGCDGNKFGSSIVFRPDGTACGATLLFATARNKVAIAINQVTGDVQFITP